MFDFGEVGKLIGDLGHIKEGLKNLQIEVVKGPISLTLNGLQEVVRVTIKPEGAIDVKRFEMWVSDCFNEGVASSRQAAKEEVERLTGWNIPSIPGLI